MSGVTVPAAFEYAKDAIYPCRNQTALLDDDGTGVGNEEGDGVLSATYVIGSGNFQSIATPAVGTPCRMNG